MCTCVIVYTAILFCWGGGVSMFITFCLHWMSIMLCHIWFCCVICLQFRRLVHFGRILGLSCHLFTIKMRCLLAKYNKLGIHNISASHCYLSILFDVNNIFFNCYWKILDIHYRSKVGVEYIFCLFLKEVYYALNLYLLNPKYSNILKYNFLWPIF